MKAFNKVILGLLAAAALILSGCPGPVSGFETPTKYETSATIDTDRMVFIEEDGSETPLLPPEEGGPEEVVDFAVVDDGGSARSSGAGNRVRVVILGRLHGRIAVWIIYRYGGMMVLPNEDQDDTELMELVEAEAWGLDGWEYDAKDVALSDDGKVIIGRFYRPGGWEFADYLGDVPDPSIGVWWSLYEKEYTKDDGETVSKLVVSRARPMLLMEEPTADTSVARCSGRHSRWNYEWFEKLLRYLTERIASAILDASWNFMADVEGFAEPAGVVIPEGFYVAKGTDRYGVPSYAWFTTASMEDIIEAPEPPPAGNSAPNDLTGFSPNPLYYSVGIQTTRVMVDPTVADPADDPVDPDGDSVTFVLDPAGNSIPPGWTFDEMTGILTVPANVGPRTISSAGLTLTFYTVDPDGLESSRVDLTLYFTAEPEI